jgi:hypothetical protein
MKNELGPVRPNRLTTLALRWWQPAPLARPTVIRELPRLPAIQRYSEVVRYSWARLEYWVSPGGRLREWARFNIGLALLIGLPAVCIVPIITFLLGQFTSWTNDLVQIAQNLLLFPLLLLGALAVATALVSCLRGLLGK